MVTPDSDSEDGVVLQVGQAEGGTDTEVKPEYVAILWLPDPTQRRGWRDLWIEKTKASKPKQAGFQRREGKG